MFNLFKSVNDSKQTYSCKDNEFMAMSTGELLDVRNVPDDVFAKEMMGKSIAFMFDGDSVTLCAPCSGSLSVLFPTGHAFGITMDSGIEILVHVGLDTVKAKGEGFKTLVKQDDVVKAGDPIVKVNIKKLAKNYNMSTILIVTNDNGKNVTFIDPQHVEKGQVIGSF